MSFGPPIITSRKCSKAPVSQALIGHFRAQLLSGLPHVNWNRQPIKRYSPDAQLIAGRWKSTQIHFDLEASVAVFELGGAGSFKAGGGTVRAKDLNFIIAVRTAEGESDPKAEARAGKIDLAWTG